MVREYGPWSTSPANRGPTTTVMQTVMQKRRNMSRQLSVETFETTNPLETFDYAQAGRDPSPCGPEEGNSIRLQAARQGRVV